MTAQNSNFDIDVSVSEPDWISSFLDVETLAAESMELALRMAQMPNQIKGRDLELSIVLANDDLIQILNREYRQKDSPTNVLTFASLDSDDPVPPDAPYPIGDVILSYQTIDREAREQGKFFRDHFLHMVVHGTLHLLGYDHETEDDANNMESLEIRILEKMNIQNPYMEKLPMA